MIRSNAVKASRRRHMSESNTEINYKEAYEREHEKCADLADKIVVLESEKEDLQFKLDRIILEGYRTCQKCDPFCSETEGTAVSLRWSQRYSAEDP